MKLYMLILRDGSVRLHWCEFATEAIIWGIERGFDMVGWQYAPDALSDS
jgi:hypothetical protein